MVDVYESLGAPALQRYLQPIDAILQTRRQQQSPGLRRLEPHDHLLGLRLRVLRHQGRHVLRAVHVQRRRVCHKHPRTRRYHYIHSFVFKQKLFSLLLQYLYKYRGKTDKSVLTLAAGGTGERCAGAVAMEPVPALDAVARVHARLGRAVRALDVTGRTHCAWKHTHPPSPCNQNLLYI